MISDVVDVPAEASLPEIVGYSALQLLQGGSRQLVYRGVQDAGGQPVLLRMHRHPYPSERQLAAQRRAFEIGKDLDGRGVPLHIELVSSGRDLVLVTEDFGGMPLDRLLRERGRPSLDTVLEIGACLARALAELHESGVVHKNLQPANVWWELTQQQLKLSGLEISSRLGREVADVGEGALEEVNLTYIAPEQTGRMNRPVDARSDLYAAGVILYELISGQPPFVSTDQRELVHAHVARRPQELREIRPAIPAALTAIVAKLLAKNPEQRYAGAAGLLYDLETFAQCLKDGQAQAFQLGTRDVSPQFRPPVHLHGRDAELRRLMSAFEAVAHGSRQTLLVGGYSGVGKSTLIRELQVPVAERDGWFCAGKFDQFRRDVPYLGWSLALASLVHQLLALPEDRLVRLRAELLASLAGNGGLIAELVPDLSLLLGEQPPVPRVGPAEAQARFGQAFRRFARVLATQEHPLVLFVDDLQWADLASLHLLESLVSDREASHMLVLGAYRDNEVGPGHRLTACVDRMAAGQHPLQVMELRPLATGHVRAMVTEVVQSENTEVDALASLVYRKTGGNPFFVGQFLNTLHGRRLLSFDAQAAQWRWSLKAIEAEDITDNVADLMSARVDALPVATRAILQVASCLGSRFGLQLLAKTAAKSVAEAASNLDLALQEGLIVPLDSNYRLAVTVAQMAERDGTQADINAGYRFLHDRVHQAVHGSVDAKERARIHLRIARERLHAIELDGGDEFAVVVMDHLGEALPLIEAQDERIRFARACLTAGRRAKASMATAPASRYLKMGRSLLPGDCWSSHYKLTLELSIESADVAYILEDFDEAAALASHILERSESLVDRMRIHNILIGIGVARRRYVDATLYGVDVLERELDLNLPRSPTMAKVFAEIALTRAALAGKSPDDLLALKEMSDPRRRAAMAVLMKTATNAYWGIPNLVPIIACRMVRLSLRHGNIGLSAYGYALFGMILSGTELQVEQAYEFGRLSMNLLEKTGDRHLIGKTGLLWHGFIRHTRDPMRVCGPETLGCYDVALDTGDIENAVYCGAVAYYTDLLAGRALSWVEKRYHSYLPALLESGQEQTTLALRVWMQVVSNLRDGENVQPFAVGQIVDWPEKLAALLTEDGSDSAIATVSGGAGWLAFVLDDPVEAERQFALLYERRRAALGQTFWKPCMALYALLLARRIAAGRSEHRDRARLGRLRRQVRRWSRRNQHDFGAFETLLRAETASAEDAGEALAGWIDGMERARQAGLLYLEAWAAERAAQAHADANHPTLARFLQDRALATWARHGALARLRQLGGARRTHLTTGNASKEESLEGLDVGAVFESVRAVSESIETNQLVARVLEISMLNAGARRGVLLLKDDGLQPLAAAEIDDDGEFEMLRATAGRQLALPRSLVEYVDRTHETLVIDDASTHEWLAKDPYVIENNSRSILGTPLLRHGQLVGLLVLENDLGVGVFTRQHANVLATIAGQAAVSLENARLFEAQRERTEAFGRFVPRPLLEQLGHRNIEEVRLGDAVQRRVAVMFIDIRNFTTLSESMSVSDNFGLLNAFLARMNPAVSAEGGIIEEFTGDGMKALFIENADAAVRAAIAMQSSLRQYNRDRGENDRAVLYMGAGVHTGEVLVGTIGSQERMSTSIIGDTVNTAARLEGLTKPYGAAFLISGATHEALADPLAYSLRPAGRVVVKGRVQPLPVYEVLDARPPDEHDALSRTVAEFSSALGRYFARDFSSAVQGFASCLEKVPYDQLAQVFHDRAATHLRDGVADDWDGVDVRADK